MYSNVVLYFKQIPSYLFEVHGAKEWCRHGTLHVRQLFLFLLHQGLSSYIQDIFSNIVDSGEDMKVQCVLLLHEET